MTRRLDPEIKALRAIGRALQATKELDVKTQRRVLGWLCEKSHAEMRKASAGRSSGEAASPDGEVGRR